MSFLNDVRSEAGSAVKTVGSAVNSVASAVGDAIDSVEDFLGAPSLSSEQGSSTLPSSRVPSQRDHVNKRHIIHWFVPEVGIVGMYVNPQSIDYTFKKIINSERTKGGYVTQYWGEELPTLRIQGHTGSSGIEGINVLYEIYRAEQYNFDPIGLTMASDATLSGLGDLVNSAGQGIGGLGGSLVSSLAGGIMGLNPLAKSILPRNPPTLSSMAFSVEMYYMGWVFRGFFNDMQISESADRLGIINYTIGFTVTQRRGYRVNNFDFQRGANLGPSNNSEGGVPLSYGKGTSLGR